MIKKITCSDITYREELQTIPIIAKFNEIIDVVNDMTKVADFKESHDFVADAARKAATTGNRKDLHEYLKLRRER